MNKIITFAKYAAVTVLVLAFLAFVWETGRQDNEQQAQALHNAVYGGDAALVEYCNTYYKITVFRECAANIEYLRRAADESGDR